MSEEAIIEKILKDGESKAARVLDNARRSRDSELRKAEAEAEKVRKEIVARARTRAETVRSKETATARIESKRAILSAREQAIGKVFEAIERRLAVLRDDTEQYRKALVNLAVEAVIAIGEDRAVLNFAARDRGLADRSLLDEIGERIKQVSHGVAIDVNIDSALEDAGCIASDVEGRMVFDNRFRRRLERLKPSLRSRIVREVLTTDV